VPRVSSHAPERLGQPLLLPRGQSLQRAELPPAHLVGQGAVREQPERDEVILAVHERAGVDGAGFGQGESLPGPPQRIGRLRQRDGQPDRAPSPVQPVSERGPAELGRLARQQQMRLRIVEARKNIVIAERLRGSPFARRGLCDGDGNDLLRERPASRLREVG